MIFEAVATGGCRSYVIGCEDTCAAALIDPELSQMDRYLSLATRHGLRIRYLIDTHTHADHFSATQQLARQLNVPVVMHSASPAPFVDLRLQGGELLVVGRLRLQALHTPGHTQDSMCLCVEDRVFTGDTLLMGGTGRTDLPSGDPAALYDSLFEGLLRLDPALKVFPAHEYKGRTHSTIGQELAENPGDKMKRTTRRDFVEVAGGGLAFAGTALAQQPSSAPAAPAAKGPRVWLDMDQAELDAAYDQFVYAPNLPQIVSPLLAGSDRSRRHFGAELSLTKRASI